MHTGNGKAYREYNNTPHVKRMFFFSGIGHSASDSMNTVEQIDASAGGSTFKDRYSSASSSSGFFDS